MKIPPLQYIKLPPPELKEFNPMEAQHTITMHLQAVVADLTDQAIINAIIKYSIEQGYDDLYIIDEKFVKSAILREGKHGSWIVTDADDGMCEDYAGFIEFKCSECGFSAGFENGQYDWFYGDPIPWKYCPNCGAKMDGERSENG